MNLCHNEPVLTVNLSIVDNEDDTATLVVTFSEGVIGFDPTTDIILTPTPSDVGLSFINMVTISTSVYHVNYNIDNGINGGLVTAYIPKARAQSILDGLDNLKSNTVGLNIISEATAPTVLLQIQNHGDNTATLLVTFSEGVTGFDETDVVITPTPSDVNLIFDEFFALSGSVYEINYLIDDGENGGSVDMQVLQSSAQSINTGLDNVDSNVLFVPINDVDPPSVVIGIVDNGDFTATLTVTFNEGVTGFTNTDVIILSSNVELIFNTMNVVSTSVYELTYDIIATSVAGDSYINIPSGSVQSISSGLNNIESNVINLSTSPDNLLPPTVNLSFVDNGDNTIRLVVFFSPGVIGFDEADVMITPSPGDVGLSFNSFSQFTSSDYWIIYDMINGVDGGSVDVQIPSLVANSDLNGLGNLESNTINIPIHSTATAPSVAVSIVDNGNDTATLTVIFSDGVVGFDETDVTVVPTPGDVGLIFVSLTPVSTATYEILYTIDNGGNGGSVDVYIPAASAQSVIGSLDNTISNIDTLPITSLAVNPSVVISIVDNGNDTATLTVTFSEGVTGFDETDVVITPTVNLGLTHDSTLIINPAQYQLEYTIVDTLGLGEFGTIDVHIPAASAQSVAASLDNTISNTETLNRGEADPALTFITTWRTTSPNEEIKIPLWSLGSDITIDWGDGNIETGFLITPTHEYAVAGDYDVSIYNGTIGTYGDIVSPSDQIKCIDIVQFGDVGITNWNNAFYKTSLTNVTATDGPVGVEVVTNMFYSIPTLTNIDLSAWDTSSVVSMMSMFKDCPLLATINVVGIDVSNVVLMTEMFSGCSSLTTVDVSGWTTSSLTDMQQMFYSCSSLTTLPVGGWNTTVLNNIAGAFQNCPLLTVIDISTWNVQNLKFANNLFTGTPVTTVQYDAILVSWSALSVQPVVNISFGTAQYSLANEPLRDILINPPNVWSIIDGGPTP